MTDQSFKFWHIRLNCDAEGHRKNDPTSADIEAEEPWGNRADYIHEWRGKGWIFHKDGRLTCPTCAQASASTRQQGD